MSRFSVEAIFRAVDRVTAPVDRMQKKVEQFTKKTFGNVSQMTGQLNRGIDSMLGGFKKIAIVGAAGFGLAAAGMTTVINTGAEFEQTLTNAAVKFDGLVENGKLVRSEYDKLEVAARKYGRSTEFNASQAAEALNFLAMAGFDANTSIAALPGVIDLATAAQVDLGTATSIAVDSMGAFNMLTGTAEERGKKLRQVSDLIAKSSISANMSMMQMFMTIKDGAPIARQAGVSIEDVSTIIAMFASTGIKGTRAGTALKRMMLGMFAPTSVASQIMSGLGIETEKLVNGERKIRNVFNVLKDIKKVMSTRTKADQIKIAKQIFGDEGIAGALGALNQFGTTMDDLQARINDYNGATKQMADIQRSTTKGSMKAFHSAIEGLKIAIFDVVKGPFKELIDRMSAWVRLNEKALSQKVADGIKWIVDNRQGILKAVVAITALTGVLAGLVIGLKIFIGVMTAVNLVMMANPVVLIVMGIAALIAIISAAVIAVVFFHDEIVAWWDSLSGVKKALISLAFPIVSLVALGSKFAKEWDGIKLLFRDIGEVFSFVGDIIEWLGGIWTKFSDWWKRGLENSAGLRVLVDIISSLADALADVAMWAGKSFASMTGLASVGKWFGVGTDVNDVNSEEWMAENRGSMSQAIRTRSEIVSRSLATERNEATLNIRTESGTTAEVAPGGGLGNGLRLQVSGGF